MEIISKEMVAIPIETIVPGVTINVDIYIGLSEDKYVLVFKGGSAIEPERLQEYRDRSVRQLHVTKDDYPRFCERHFTIAGIAIKHPKVPVPHKISFLSTANELLLTKLGSLGFSGESFEAAKTVAQSVITLVSLESHLLRILERFNQNAPTMLNHSLAVGLVATMIGRSLGWTRPDTLEKLALGGLLHDIGMQEIAPHLHTKPRVEMSYEELREYESHAYRGMQILQALDIVPADIVSIAYEHHENSIGQGYPRRLWDMKINPLARVVALADTFCELTLASESHPRPKSPTEAVFHIEAIMGQPFNKEAFKKLRTMVQNTRASGSDQGAA